MLIKPQSLAIIIIIIIIISGDSVVGIATRWIFRTRPGRSWCRPSFLFNGNRVSPGGQRPVREVDGPPLLAPGLQEE